MELLLMLAQTEAVAQPPSPWLLILGFVCLGYAIYESRKKRTGGGGSSKQAPPRKKADMISKKDDKSASAIDDVAREVADEMDKSKKRKK